MKVTTKYYLLNIIITTGKGHQGITITPWSYNEADIRNVLWHSYFIGMFEWYFFIEKDNEYKKSQKQKF